MYIRLHLLWCAASLALAGCPEWQRNVTVRGVPFSRVKVEAGGLLIGELNEDTIVNGRPCKRGWIHVHPNGTPAGFTAGRDLELGQLVIPAGTWVSQGNDGAVTVCAFPRDTEVQGHWCRGTGGPKGVQTAFYANSALKQFFPPRATRIDGVPCASGLLHGFVELYENGRLKSCLLGADFERGGYFYSNGIRIEFQPDGRVHPTRSALDQCRDAAGVDMTLENEQAIFHFVTPACGRPSADHDLFAHA